MSEEDRKGIDKTNIPGYGIQRDIFIFQCFIGCRVGDLLTLRPGNIVNGILVYTPHKTKNNGDQAVQARVPLHPKALELVKKYEGVSTDGLLFPFITEQKYNIAIKKIFKLAGITRNVIIRNPKTGEDELRPINEVASRCGFKDPCYFTKLFRRFKGASPRDFRESIPNHFAK